MRPRLLASCVFCVVAALAGGPTSAFAANGAPPPALEPLPEIPPPPNLEDAELEPQITISQNKGETVEEARVNGTLIWIKVTPRHGRSYYLIPNGGGNTYIRRDSLDTGLKVPMWVLFSW
jgi:Protein of unknown function (DUF2782)